MSYTIRISNLINVSIYIYFFIGVKVRNCSYQFCRWSYLSFNRYSL